MARKEYLKGNLTESDLDSSPINQFAKWYDEAKKTSNAEPNALALSTVSDNKPDSRMVLLKIFNEYGFIFATNYESSKSKQLLDNPNAHMLFYWPELERQVRISGLVKKATKEASDQIFYSRPKGSQIAAIASKQSSVISARSELEKEYQKTENAFKTTEPVRPDYWGAYLLIPDRFEFWQGRENRLHDRIIYEYKSNTWQIYRVAP